MPLSLSGAQRQPLGGPFNFFLILCKFVYMHVYFFCLCECASISARAFRSEDNFQGVTSPPSLLKKGLPCVCSCLCWARLPLELLDRSSVSASHLAVNAGIAGAGPPHSAF